MRIRSLLLSTAARLALTGPASAETIIDALVSAYQNNADLMAAREELRVTLQYPTYREGLKALLAGL